MERILESSPAGAPLAVARTGPDGHFRFAEVGPGLYEVLAIAPDGVRAAAHAQIETDGARVRAVIELPSGGETLRGIAVHRDGSPFVGRVAAMVGRQSASIIAHRSSSAATAFWLLPRGRGAKTPQHRPVPPVSVAPEVS